MHAYLVRNLHNSYKSRHNLCPNEFRYTKVFHGWGTFYFRQRKPLAEKHNLPFIFYAECPPLSPLRFPFLPKFFFCSHSSIFLTYRCFTCPLQSRNILGKTKSSTTNAGGGFITDIGLNRARFKSISFQRRVSTCIKPKQN